jgi:hypothetical protein
LISINENGSDEGRKDKAEEERRYTPELKNMYRIVAVFL